MTKYSLIAFLLLGLIACVPNANAVFKLKIENKEAYCVKDADKDSCSFWYQSGNKIIYCNVLIDKLESFNLNDCEVKTTLK